MADIDRIVGVIEKGELTQIQLGTQYDNVAKNKSVSETDRERLVEAIEHQLRTNFPRKAKDLFGAKDQAARKVLSNIDSSIKEDLDLSKNKVKDGVKTGGEMISGKKFVSVYLYYKNADDFGTYLVLEQETNQDDLVAVVGYKKVGGDDAGVIEEKSFDLSKLDEIESTYRDFLSRVVEG
jgi:hypothetical protein